MKIQAALLFLSAACIAVVFIHTGGTGLAPAAITARSMPGLGERLAMMPAADVATVVQKAEAFKALLTPAQISTLQQGYTPALAHRWSNLPCGSGCRNGLQFSTLTEAQLAAALEVIAAASGTAADEGFDEFQQIRTADSVLGTSAGGGYSKGIYFIAFLNEPSASGPWMLQFGGHHYAGNIAFNNGGVIGASPRFEGVEPLTFTAADGKTYAPISQEHDAMAAMLASLSPTELAGAKLTSSFGDVLLGPNQDGKFPTAKQGLAVSSLTTAQKALVLDAMRPWVRDADDATAATLLAIYESELDATYIAWTGGSALNANGNYARIDGPGVWIEFVCQNGVVYRNQIHYHTVWRDHTRDYGADLAGTLSGVAAEMPVAAASAVYPNPARDVVTVTLPRDVAGASVRVFDDRGREVLASRPRSGASIRLDISALASGAYVMRIEGREKTYTGRFTKVR